MGVQVNQDMKKEADFKTVCAEYSSDTFLKNAK